MRKIDENKHLYIYGCDESFTPVGFCNNRRVGFIDERLNLKRMNNGYKFFGSQQTFAQKWWCREQYHCGIELKLQEKLNPYIHIA